MTSVYKKIPHCFFLLVFAAAFGFLSVENTLLSDQWGLLLLRELDDFALLSSTYRLLALIQSGHLGSLRFFDYAYGSAFWWSNLAILYPFIKTNSPQMVIVAAREITLVSGFLALYFVYKISYRFTGKVGFSYFTALLTLTMPVFVYWSQKFHVNVESMLLGLIAYYLLIRKDTLGVSALCGSAVFGGLAIGFKLTGVLLLPTLGLTALYLLWSDPLWQSRRTPALIAYAVIIGLTAIAATAPVLLVFPFQWKAANEIVATFSLFQKLGAAPVKVEPALLLQAVGDSTVTVVGLGVVLTGLLIWSWRKGKLDPLPLILFANLVVALVAVTLVVRKGPSYSSAYFVHMVPFLVFGFVPLAKIRSAFVGSLACLAVFIAIRHELLMPLAPETYANLYEMVSHSPPLPRLVPMMTKYYRMAKDPNIQQDSDDLREMAAIIPKPTGPLKILSDANTVFPYTSFDNEIYQTVNYSPIEIYKNNKYDYIILNKNCSGPNKNSDKESEFESRKCWYLGDNDRDHEIESRNELLIGATFGGKKYKRIYDGRTNVVFAPDN